jgi:hypothetical protein
MAENDSTPPTRFGKLTDIPFRCDSKYERRFAAGTFCVFEDVVAGAVVMLLTPAGPTKPLRLLISFDSALEAAHSLIAASARLHRAGGAS